MASTASLFSAQWTNPSDVSTVVMIIGGDVVRTALAQSTGTWFTPVCFSFGWVSYAFMVLVNVLGDGRLLPQPDFPVKVFNLSSGYVRQNQNWVIGRIMRDHETWINTKSRWDQGIRISIFEAKENKNCWTKFSYDWIHLFGLFWMIVQHVIASIPVIIAGDWSIVLLTAAGTVLALAHGALPQWVAEKLPNRQHADFIFGLTTGNGSRDIMVIKGLGRCLNLEQLSVTDTPRNGTPWEKFSKFALPRHGSNSELPRVRRTGSIPRHAIEFHGLPAGFWITVVTTIIQTALWLAFLISVAAVKQNTWYLLAVGFIGMFQNGIIAALGRPNAARNLPVKLVGTIKTRKVMDGLMDLQVHLGCAQSLVQEFFPGELNENEKKWWKGDRAPYDAERTYQRAFRGAPGGGLTLEETHKSGELEEDLPPYMTPHPAKWTALKGPEDTPRTSSPAMPTKSALSDPNKAKGEAKPVVAFSGVTKEGAEPAKPLSHAQCKEAESTLERGLGTEVASRHSQSTISITPSWG
jgi:hypothetical protein